MTNRTVEDRLREEYSQLLPDVVRVVDELDARARYAVMPIAAELKGRHERIVVRSRVKGCESAIAKLRPKEGKLFDQDTPEHYRLETLPDLAGVRVLVFPKSHNDRVRGAMAEAFPSWEADHIRGQGDRTILAWKHHGYCPGNQKIKCEYQVVPMLVGLFWEVEHAALYKPDPQLVGVTNEPGMKEHTDAVLSALEEFEDEFVRIVQASPP